MNLDEIQKSPNALASHYSRFRVSERFLLTGHSHQAWPDVAEQGQLEAFADAADVVDAKWERAFAKADRVREGFRLLLDEPAADLALDSNTHALVIRFLSALDLRAKPRLVTTDSEFHTLRRQLARLAEEDVEVVRLPATPVETLASRLADAIDGDTSAVLVSAVLFTSSQIVPHLGALASACAAAGVELLVDAYHALGVVPFSVPAMGLSSAWITAGGYKYLQLGEGNCFLRLPAQAAGMRPVITGWFAEFEALPDAAAPELVAYSPGGDRFAGSTYDPTSHYRAARVFDFFAAQGLTPEFLRVVSVHQTELLADAFDALGAPDELITRDRSAPRTAFGGFLSLRSSKAAELQRALAARGVHTDSRGENLRFGPAPYLSDEQLEGAMTVLGKVLGLR
jgi:kynureninase